MLEEMPAHWWAEWVQFYAIEPWGFDVTDGFNAILASTVARAFGADVTPNDFLMGPRIPERAVEEESEPVDLHEQVKRLFGHKDYKGPPNRRA